MFAESGRFSGRACRCSRQMPAGLRPSVELCSPEDVSSKVSFGENIYFKSGREGFSIKFRLMHITGTMCD